MSLHEPHVFSPSLHNPRIRGCMKCGRMPEWYWHVEPEPETPPDGLREAADILRQAILAAESWLARWDPPPKG